MIHKNTKILAITSSVFLIVSIVIFVIFLEVLSKEKEVFITKSIAQEETRIQHDSLSRLMQTLEVTEDARALLKTRILKEDDVVDLLSLIESLGKEQNVSLTTSSLTVQPINEVFETLIINVQVTGAYESVKHILKLLEHLPYQATLGRIQLGRDGISQGNVWQGSYEVRVTKYKEI